MDGFFSDSGIPLPCTPFSSLLAPSSGAYHRDQHGGEMRFSSSPLLFTRQVHSLLLKGEALTCLRLLQRLLSPSICARPLRWYLRVATEGAHSGSAVPSFSVQLFLIYSVFSTPLLKFGMGLPRVTGTI